MSKFHLENKFKKEIVTEAFDAIFVNSVTLVTATRKTADAVLAATVFAHVRKRGALVDVFTVDVTMSFRTQLFERCCAGFRARVAIISPSFADTATAHAFQVVAF